MKNFEWFYYHWGGILVHQQVFLPHSSGNYGSILTVVICVWMLPCGHVGFLWWLGFHPTSQKSSKVVDQLSTMVTRICRGK